MAAFLYKIKTYGELIKFEHTVFALPFAYIGAIAANRALPGVVEFFWITVGLTAARSAAMGLNRVIDREIDALNPRTADRHLPRGLVQVKDVLCLIFFSLIFFVCSVAMLSPAHLVYLPLIMLFLVGYSYTKRFTWMSHLILGVTDSFASLGGWIAVTRAVEPAAFFLAGGVVFWIAGFDIIYALLDLDFDKKYKLCSIPARFGPEISLLIARIFHVLTMLLLLGVYFLTPLDGWFLTGLVLAGLLLCYEHNIIASQDLSRVNMAFFNVNGLISIELLLFTVLDVLM